MIATKDVITKKIQILHDASYIGSIISSNPMEEYFQLSKTPLSSVVSELSFRSLWEEKKVASINFGGKKKGIFQLNDAKDYRFQVST